MTENIRDHVIVENQHQPTTMNIRTFINRRYKLTVHFNQEYGELYDLEEDPGEYENLWDNLKYGGLLSNSPSLCSGMVAFSGSYMLA